MLIISAHCVYILCTQVTGATAVHFAAKTGNVAIYRLLLRGGADMEIKDKVRAA